MAEAKPEVLPNITKLSPALADEVDAGEFRQVGEIEEPDFEIGRVIAVDIAADDGGRSGEGDAKLAGGAGELAGPNEGEGRQLPWAGSAIRLHRTIREDAKDQENNALRRHLGPV